MDRVSFYVPKEMHNRIQQGNHPLYSRLIKMLDNVGVVSKLYAPVDVLDDPNEYSLHHNRIVEGPNSLTAWPTPLDRFWQISKGENPIGQEIFNKKEITNSKSSDFFYKLVAHEVNEPENPYAIENYILAVVQPELNLRHNGQWCSGVQMIERTLKFDLVNRLVVWMDPKIQFSEADYAALETIRNNDRVFFSKTNQDRILTNCEYVVTQSHGIGFRANLYKKSVILFGETPFGHVAQNIFQEERPKRSFNRVERARIEYEKYVYWYLGQKSLDTRGPKNHLKILETCAKLGWSIE